MGDGSYSVFEDLLVLAWVVSKIYVFHEICDVIGVEEKFSAVAEDIHIQEVIKVFELDTVFFGKDFLFSVFQSNSFQS